jgi:hypothetical protein
MHLTRKTLNRLIDAELSAGEDRAARDHLLSCQDCEAAHQVGLAMRELTREALLAVARDVSFEKMQAEIATAIAVERPLGWGDRFKVWLGEFFQYRRPVWVPAGALAAAAIVAIAMFPGTEAQAMGSSRVLSVATVADPAVVFDVQSDDGTTSTGIVWITDSPDAEVEGG